MGQKVYVTGTDWLDLDSPTVEGEHDVVFTLRQPSFGGGKYFVNATLLGDDKKAIHNVMQAASFNVEADPHAIGFMRIDVEASA